MNLSGLNSCALCCINIHVPWYGLKLHIPEGAIPQKWGGCKIDIKAGLAGQFEFTDDKSQLVSCIYWLSCPQKFLEPVTLEIQHCGLIEDSSTLHFVVAKCSQPQLPYTFKALDKGTFSPHSSYGSLQVSQFSFFGIRGRCRRYYGAVYYNKTGHNRWYVDFVMTRNLEVHLKVSGIYDIEQISGPLHFAFMTPFYPFFSLESLKEFTACQHFLTRYLHNFIPAMDHCHSKTPQF